MYKNDIGMVHFLELLLLEILLCTAVVCVCVHSGDLTLHLISLLLRC